MKNYINFIKESSKEDVIALCIKSETFNPLIYLKEYLSSYVYMNYYKFDPETIKNLLIFCDKNDINIDIRNIEPVYRYLDNLFKNEKFKKENTIIGFSKYNIKNKTYFSYYNDSERFFYSIKIRNELYEHITVDALDILIAFYAKKYFKLNIKEAIISSNF